MAGRKGIFGRMFGRAEPPAPRIEPRLEARIPAPAPDGAAARAYKAAKIGRLAGGFSLGPTSPRAEIRQDLRGLIQHARHGAQNVDYLRSYEMMVRRHVVGRKGLQLQMTARDPSGALDRIGNRRVEAGWTEWGARGNCTTCGRLSWWQVEGVAATMLAREGNFLARLWSGREFGPHGFQIQPVSVDLLDLQLVMNLPGGRYIDGGIEFDAMGRVLAYHMFQGHPAEYHVTPSATDRRRIPAAEIIHVIRPMETAQALGIPASHTAIRRLNMLGRYEEAALAAAHHGAAAMVFLKRPEDAGPGAASPAGFDVPEEVEAGMIAELPPGWDIASHVPNYPDAAMPGFNKAMLRGGAAGLGVSYAGLTSDMEGSSFSSLKDGRGEERDEWRMFQRDLSEGLHNEVFRSWLPRALLTPRIRLPFDKLDKFAGAATWRPRGWISANPRDDVTMTESDIGNLLRSPSDIVADRGEDFEETVARIAEDLAILDAAGLPRPMALQPKASAPADPSAAAQAEDGAPDDGAPKPPAT